MDSFSYLSVILSIVLGLAIAQVLLGFRSLILTRAKLKLYPPTLIWAGIALLIPIQAWWADFALRKQPNWTFLAFLVIMLQAISIYMMAALVLPDGKTSKRYWIQFTRIRCPAYGTWLALIAAMFYSFARVSAVLKLKVDDYYDNGCAGEWDHLKREMPWKSPSSRRHLTS